MTKNFQTSSMVSGEWDGERPALQITTKQLLGGNYLAHKQYALLLLIKNKWKNELLGQEMVSPVSSSLKGIVCLIEDALLRLPV